jgi:hypothetical protein
VALVSKPASDLAFVLVSGSADSAEFAESVDSVNFGNSARSNLLSSHHRKNERRYLSFGWLPF